ncbi:MAG: mandelate racemase/muconate lactonizing enzyme family protein [Planctomycetia bacterium]|nr:mandelate racemase/muconate lactonizing enzyme family protein [Planctomycetia bacterium]
MKITDVRCHVMGVPTPDGNETRRNWIFVFVDTDAGISGLGEATTEWHELAVAAMVKEHLRPRLIGQDPTHIERVWQSLQRGFWWRGGVVAASAISGVDQALWDIAGKAYGVPVYKLLGGPARDSVRLYARGDLGLSSLIDEARAAVAEGFDAFKAGPGRMLQPFDDRRQVDVTLAEYRHLREAVGPAVDLIVDCGGLFGPQAAARLVAGLRELELLFVEEPINADLPSPLAALKRAFPDVRIAAGERLCTRWAFREWLSEGAVDVIQADVSHTGGISELMKIAHCAEVYNVLMAPHSPYGPVALAASAHASAAMANFLILEHCRLRPWFDQVQRFGPVLHGGHFLLDDRPGLGVELDLALIERHPYRPLPPRTYMDRWGAMPPI